MMTTTTPARAAGVVSTATAEQSMQLLHDVVLYCSEADCDITPALITLEKVLLARTLIWQLRHRENIRDAVLMESKYTQDAEKLRAQTSRSRPDTGAVQMLLDIVISPQAWVNRTLETVAATETATTSEITRTKRRFAELAMLCHDSLVVKQLYGYAKDAAQMQSRGLLSQDTSLAVPSTLAARRLTWSSVQTLDLTATDMLNDNCVARYLCFFVGLQTLRLCFTGLTDHSLQHIADTCANSLRTFEMTGQTLHCSSRGLVRFLDRCWNLQTLRIHDTESSLSSFHSGRDASWVIHWWSASVSRPGSDGHSSSSGGSGNGSGSSSSGRCMCLHVQSEIDYWTLANLDTLQRLDEKALDERLAELVEFRWNVGVRMPLLVKNLGESAAALMPLIAAHAPRLVSWECDFAMGDDALASLLQWRPNVQHLRWNGAQLTDSGLVALLKNMKTHQQKQQEQQQKTSASAAAAIATATAPTMAEWQALYISQTTEWKADMWYALTSWLPASLTDVSLTHINPLFWDNTLTQRLVKACPEMRHLRLEFAPLATAAISLEEQLLLIAQSGGNMGLQHLTSTALPRLETLALRAPVSSAENVWQVVNGLQKAAALKRVEIHVGIVHKEQQQQREQELKVEQEAMRGPSYETRLAMLLSNAQVLPTLEEFTISKHAQLLCYEHRVNLLKSRPNVLWRFVRSAYTDDRTPIETMEDAPSIPDHAPRKLQARQPDYQPHLEQNTTTVDSESMSVELPPLLSLSSSSSS